MDVDRGFALALSVGLLLVAVLAIVSHEYDWSVGAIYGGFAVVATIAGAILAVSDRRRTPRQRD